ncbi:CsbD family protein [Xylophilus sp. Kf1]|nr:CsbD family protein [Xylophilus sp. Kf1]
MFNKAEGTFQQIAGHIQDAVGGVIGQRGTQLEGKARQLGGKAQAFGSDAFQQIRQSATANPVTTIALIAGIALFLRSALAKR